MPRAPLKTEPDIPLFLIPHVIQKQIRLLGENVERVVVRKTASHFYNISIRTRAIKRELFGRRAGTRNLAAVPAGEDGGDA
jgi:hypothetical protein